MLYTSGIVWPESGVTCISVRPYATVRSTIARNESFKASNGWLHSFKQSHSIVQLVVSGSQVMYVKIQWRPGRNDFQLLSKDMLWQIRIWNEDETACFF